MFDFDSATLHFRETWPSKFILNSLPCLMFLIKKRWHRRCIPRLCVTILALNALTTFFFIRTLLHAVTFLFTNSILSLFKFSILFSLSNFCGLLDGSSLFLLLTFEFEHREIIHFFCFKKKIFTSKNPVMSASAFVTWRMSLEYFFYISFVWDCVSLVPDRFI